MAKAKGKKSKTNHVMVDIETLGTEPGSVVLSIGAVMFDPVTKKLGKKFYVNIDLQSSIDAGLCINADTVYWWLKQSKEAGEVLSANTWPLDVVCEDFAKYFKSVAPCYLWANGAGFDQVLLRVAFQHAGVEWPVPFWMDRCFRTLKSGHKGFKAENKIKHNALEDAIYQAKCAIEIMNGDV